MGEAMRRLQGRALWALDVAVTFTFGAIAQAIAFLEQGQ